jgi:hypothetical protein
LLAPFLQTATGPTMSTSFLPNLNAALRGQGRDRRHSVASDGRFQHSTPCRRASSGGVRQAYSRASSPLAVRVRGIWTSACTTTRARR